MRQSSGQGGKGAETWGRCIGASPCCCAAHTTERMLQTKGECLPGTRPAHARRATFVLSILSLAPGLSSSWEVPQVDRTRPQTFPARHVASAEI